jgi:hypothetical protein
VRQGQVEARPVIHGLIALSQGKKILPGKRRKKTVDPLDFAARNAGADTRWLIGAAKFCGEKTAK